jgi:hypothetical protein
VFNSRTIRNCRPAIGSAGGGPNPIAPQPFELRCPGRTALSADLIATAIGVLHERYSGLGIDTDDTRKRLEIVIRIYALGSMAVRRSEWETVHTLTLKPTSVYSVTLVEQSLSVIVRLSEGTPHHWLSDNPILTGFLSNDLNYGLQRGIVKTCGSGAFGRCRFVKVTAAAGECRGAPMDNPSREVSQSKSDARQSAGAARAIVGVVTDRRC